MIMGIKRMSVLMATLAFVLASPRLAAAETVRVTGTITETAPGICSLPVLTGTVARIECVGLEDTWTGGVSGIGVFDEAISLNFVSGEVHIRGTETFTGCVGASCGGLEWAYEGFGKLDLETFAVLYIRGVQHLTGGTGGLSGARGSIGFSLIGEGPATYEGVVVP
jgi:hypothetical protein